MRAGILAVIERRQDALELGWVFERGNHVHLPATGRTGFYLDLEHPLQEFVLGVAHQQTTLLKMPRDAITERVHEQI